MVALPMYALLEVERSRKPGDASSIWEEPSREARIQRPRLPRKEDSQNRRSAKDSKGRLGAVRSRRPLPGQEQVSEPISHLPPRHVDPGALWKLSPGGCSGQRPLAVDASELHGGGVSHAAGDAVAPTWSCSQTSTKCPSTPASNSPRSTAVEATEPPTYDRSLYSLAAQVYNSHQATNPLVAQVYYSHQATDPSTAQVHHSHQATDPLAAQVYYPFASGYKQRRPQRYLDYVEVDMDSLVFELAPSDVLERLNPVSMHWSACRITEQCDDEEEVALRRLMAPLVDTGVAADSP